jgi:hypothetical protein
MALLRWSLSTILLTSAKWSSTIITPAFLQESLALAIASWQFRHWT